MAGERERVHATAIALGGRAALLRGPSGSGKSDLALRCLAAAPSGLVPHSCTLLADDQVELELTDDGRLLARCPDAIEGKIEVRGLGVLSLDASALSPFAEVVLAVDLVAPHAIERFPIARATAPLLGKHVPLIQISPFEVSAHLKVLLALYFGTDSTGG